MKSLTYKAPLITFFLFSCSEKPIVELPITTTSTKALEHFIKSQDFGSTADFREGRIELDSALVLDPEFTLALLNKWDEDPRVTAANKKKAYSMINKVTPAEKLILKANKASDIGNLDSGLFYIKKLVEENPEAYEPYTYLGFAYGLRNELMLAEQAYKKAIELNPNNYESYVYLCGQHIPFGFYPLLPENQRNIEKGREYADKLIELKPNKAHGYHFKANTYRQTGEFTKAIPLYDKAVELAKGTENEFGKLMVSAHNLMFSGDFNKARDRYKRSMELAAKKSNNQAETILSQYITFSYLFQKDFEGALDNLYAAFDALENKKNTFSEAFYINSAAELERIRFLCYAHNQMEKDAKKSLSKTNELNKKLAMMMQDENAIKNQRSNQAYRTAWNDILFGNYQSARNNLETLQSIASTIQSPQALDGYYGLMGMLYLMEGNSKKSEEYFNKQNNNTDTYFNYFKALALKANRKKEEAKEILSNIAGDNFSYLELALVKVLAVEQLKKL